MEKYFLLRRFTMFCTKCGQQVDDRATICPYCGSPMENASEPNTPPVNTPPAYTPPSYTPPPAPPAAPSKGLGIASLILGACGIVFAWILALLGYMLGGAGLALAIIGKVKKCGPTATIGLILSIVTLVFAFINSVLGVLMMLG